MKKKRVLMVCFGNTCRSPMAEAIFKKYIADNNLENDWEVESAALYGYHAGKGMNAKALRVLEINGITNSEHLARTIRVEDFNRFDWMLGMDYYNIEHLGEIQPQGTKVDIELLGQYDPNGETIIEDPYFETDIRKFEKIYEQCKRSIPMFIQAHTNK